MPKKNKNEKLSAYILLDRSGSMNTRWQEAVSSINAYVDELIKNKAQGDVTFAMFDDHAGLQYELIDNGTDLKDWEPIDYKKYSPRGGTPLYDAAMRLIGSAEQKGSNKTVIIIMTDGQENASKEMTKDKMTAAINSAKTKGWEVIFLGADFDAYHGTAAGLGVGINKSFTMQAGNYAGALRGMATQTVAYASNNVAMDTNSLIPKNLKTTTN